MAFTVHDAASPEPSPADSRHPAGAPLRRADVPLGAWEGSASAGAAAVHRGRNDGGWLAAQSGDGVPDPHRYLLLLRFALVNIVGAALLGAAWISGYVDKVVAADSTMLSVAIFAVFLGGLVVCAVKVIHTSRELNAVRASGPRAGSLAANYLSTLRGATDEGRSLLAGTLRLKLSHRIAIVKHIAGALVILGLIGTVVGFIIALSGVDPDKASDIESISPMVSTLIRGMSTALYTTLVGAVLNIWLMANYRLLATGTVHLIAHLIEFGERNGRA